jgi:flagellar hook-length control protein FliK
MQNAGVNAAQAMMSFMVGAQDKISQKVAGGAFSSELDSQRQALLGKGSGLVHEGGETAQSSDSSTATAAETTPEGTELGTQNGLSDAVRTKLVREKASEKLYFSRSELAESVLGKLGVSAQDRQDCNFSSDDEGRVSMKSLSDALDSLRKKPQGAATASLEVSAQDVAALLGSLQQAQGQSVSDSDMEGLKIDGKSSYNATELTALLQNAAETLGKKSLTHFVSDRNGSSTVNDLVDETSATSGLTDNPQRLVQSLTPSLSNGVTPVKTSKAAISGAAGNSGSPEDETGNEQDASFRPFIDAYTGSSAGAIDAAAPSSLEEAPWPEDSGDNRLANLKDALPGDGENALPDAADGNMVVEDALPSEQVGLQRNSTLDGLPPLSFGSSYRNVQTAENNSSPTTETVTGAPASAAEGDASTMQDAPDADGDAEAIRVLPNIVDESAGISASRGGSGASFADGGSEREDSPSFDAVPGPGTERATRIAAADNAGVSFADSLGSDAAPATATASVDDAAVENVGLSEALNGLWKAAAGGDDIKTVSEASDLSAPVNPLDGDESGVDGSDLLSAAGRFLRGLLESAGLSGGASSGSVEETTPAPVKDSVLADVAGANQGVAPEPPIAMGPAASPAISADASGTDAATAVTEKFMEYAPAQAPQTTNPDPAIASNQPVAPGQAMESAAASISIPVGTDETSAATANMPAQAPQTSNPDPAIASNQPVAPGQAMESAAAPISIPVETDGTSAATANAPVQAPRITNPDHAIASNQPVAPGQAMESAAAPISIPVETDGTSAATANAPVQAPQTANPDPAIASNQPVAPGQAMESAAAPISIPVEPDGTSAATANMPAQAPRITNPDPAIASNQPVAPGQAMESAAAPISIPVETDGTSAATANMPAQAPQTANPDHAIASNQPVAPGQATDAAQAASYDETNVGAGSSQEAAKTASAQIPATEPTPATAGISGTVAPDQAQPERLDDFSETERAAVVSSASPGDPAASQPDSIASDGLDSPGAVKELQRADSGGAFSSVYSDAATQTQDAVDEPAAASRRDPNVAGKSERAADLASGGAEQAVKAPSGQGGAGSASTGGDSQDNQDASASIDDLIRLDKSRSQKIGSEHYQAFAESLQNSVSHQNSASAGKADGTLSLSDPSWTQDLSRQIQDLHRQDRNRMTLELEPRNLGRLTITIEAVKDQVNAVVSTGSEHVRDMLLNNSSALSTHLQQEGLTLNQLQVDVRQQGNGRQAFEQTWAQQGQRSISSGKDGSFDQTPQTVLNAAYVRPATSGRISLFA